MSNVIETAIEKIKAEAEKILNSPQVKQEEQVAKADVKALVSQAKTDVAAVLKDVEPELQAAAVAAIENAFKVLVTAA